MSNNYEKEQEEFDSQLHGHDKVEYDLKGELDDILMTEDSKNIEHEQGNEMTR